jgi:pseudouridine-5'-monophosphatase
LKNVNCREEKRVMIATASNSSTEMFEFKSAKQDVKELLDTFDEELRILGDHPGLKKGRAEPDPDLFLLVLNAINLKLGGGETKIRPEGCLVFEDSVQGVEAGRRADMRVVWVPHPDLATEYEGREEEVVAGRIGLSDIGDEEQLGRVGDGRGIMFTSLRGFLVTNLAFRFPEW